MSMLQYLINVATPNNKVRHPSRKLLKDTCKVAASFGAKAVIVHGGSVGEGGDIGEGYENWRKAIEHVEDTGMRVLVENTAGGKNSVARYMDSIERLWEVIGHFKCWPLFRYLSYMGWRYSNRKGS
jgi:deoxyribonuclease-4